MWKTAPPYSPVELEVARESLCLHALLLVGLCQLQMKEQQQAGWHQQWRSAEWREVGAEPPLEASPSPDFEEGVAHRHQALAEDWDWR